MAERDEFSAFLIGFIVGGLTSASELADKAKTGAEELRHRGQVVIEEQRARLQKLGGSAGEEETPI
jgi:hypothetical protein